MEDIIETDKIITCQLLCSLRPGQTMTYYRGDFTADILRSTVRAPRYAATLFHVRCVAQSLAGSGQIVLTEHRERLSPLPPHLIIKEDARKNKRHIPDDDVYITKYLATGATINLPQGVVQEPEPPPLFRARIDALNLSTRSTNGLKGNDILYLGDLVLLSENSVRQIKNLGWKCVMEITDALKKRGLSLGMDVPGWPLRASGHEIADPVFVLPAIPEPPAPPAGDDEQLPHESGDTGQ